MSTSQQQHIEWTKIREASGPYPIEAFTFVREGLSYTAERVHGDVSQMPEMDRHVSGQQLCLGLRDFAIDRYGLLAPSVLDHWRVRRTEDFGRIVFGMIDAGLMSSTQDDTPDAFRGVFDFCEAFSEDEIRACL
jgi:uncharacterized repeat protein (TIGR04138 family)